MKEEENMTCKILDNQKNPCPHEAEIGDMCYFHWRELEGTTSVDDSPGILIRPSREFLYKEQEARLLTDDDI